MSKSEQHLNTLDWAKLGLATAIAAVTMSTAVMAWAYGTFTTKDVFELIIDRLDRIESKLDGLIR